MRSRLRAATNAVFRRLKSPPGAGASFVASLSPAAWYRYGQGITSSGGLVSAWADQSGNGRNLVQLTGTNQPSVSADGTITFDGVDNFMRVAFTLVQPVTFYIVWRANAAANNSRIVDGATNGTIFSYLRWNATSLATVLNAGSGAGTLATTAGTWMVDFTVANSTNSLHARNTGVDDDPADAGTNNPGGITVGANTSTSPSNFSNSSVREIIVFPAAHDEATRQRVVNYLLPMIV